MRKNNQWSITFSKSKPGVELEELQRKTDIQLDMLEALESDDFDDT